MKKIITLILLICTTNVKAQTSKELTKARIEINKASNAVNNVNGTARETKAAVKESAGLIQGLGNLLPLKKTKDDKQDQETEKIAGTPPTNSATPQPTPVTAPASAPVNAAPGNATQSVITISNINYPQMKNISTQLKSNTNVFEIAPSLTGNVATLIIKHNGNTDALIDFLMSTPNNNLNVNSFQNGSAQLSLK